MAYRDTSGIAFDASRPNVARVYDYLLGGQDNFAADRALGDEIIAGLPEIQAGVLAQRAVLGRVVRYLVGTAGVSQLLDIGSGLPTADNVHEIAQRVAPQARARVVYVDNDPGVIAHARALLSGSTGSLAEEGDVLAPSSVVGNPAVREHLDWDRPVGLLLCGIMHYILDEDRPAEIMAELIEALPSGSYVFIHHLLDTGDPAAAELQARLRKGLGRVRFRTLDEVRRLFCGLPLVEPGLVPVPEWRSDLGTPVEADNAAVLSMACAGVARKPLYFIPNGCGCRWPRPMAGEYGSPDGPAAGACGDDTPCLGDRAHQQQPAPGHVVRSGPADGGFRVAVPLIGHLNPQHAVGEPQGAADDVAAAVHDRVGDEFAEDQRRGITAQPGGGAAPCLGGRGGARGQVERLVRRLGVRLRHA